VVGQPAIAEGRPATLSVCEVFDNLDLYSGKLVEIRGLLSTSRELMALHDSDCRLPFKGRWKDWPKAINLTTASPTAPHTARIADLDSLRAPGIVLDFFQEVPPRELGVEVTLTVVGRLEAIEDRLPSASGDPNTSSRNLGFGNLRSFAAQLVCEGVRDIVLGQIR